MARISNEEKELKRMAKQDAHTAHTVGQQSHPVLGCSFKAVFNRIVGALCFLGIVVFIIMLCTLWVIKLETQTRYFRSQAQYYELLVKYHDEIYELDDVDPNQPAVEDSAGK